MAKHKCAICGAEVGLVSGQKLADGNYICRKVCGKKCLKVFDQVHATLEDVNAHIAQVEWGTKVWQQLLEPLRKTKNKEEKLKWLTGSNGVKMYVSPSTGLLALVQVDYKIFVFGKTERACVYRVADLVNYEYESEKKIVDGKEQVKHYCLFVFEKTEGMSSFRLSMDSKNEYVDIEKYFAKLFGIEKTVRNIASTTARQVNAAKAVFGAVKDLKNGTLDEAGASETMDALRAVTMGDRRGWIAKADAALSQVK